MSADDQVLKDLWEWNFGDHTPTVKSKKQIDGLRYTANAMKDAIIAMSPNSRERSLALTHLEQVLFYSVAAVLRNQNNDEAAGDMPEEDKALAAEKEGS